MEVLITMLNITNLTILHIEDTKQLKRKLIRRREMKSTYIITSNTLSNLNDNVDIKKMTLKDFKLKEYAPGNALLFPLFDIKNKEGCEIDAGFVDTLDFNGVRLYGNTFVGTPCQFFGYIDIKNTRENLILQAFDTASLFIFLNPDTENLSLYVFFPFGDGCKPVNINKNSNCENNELKSFFVCFQEQESRDSTVFIATKNQLEEKYILEYPFDLRTLSFSFVKTGSDTFTISDTNDEKEYVAIKPESRYKEGHILAYYLLNEKPKKIPKKKELSVKDCNFSIERETDIDRESLSGDDEYLCTIS
ncbi:hypothetical protein CDIK_1247 [Cucumispora dikerogammari]|nr:hypothetical protein CDIK_1247 [Cucumispora dikerogammari]